MAREKAKTRLQWRKADLAKSLIRARSISETIDVALDRLIRAAQLRHDVAAYTRVPLTKEELLVADLPVDFDLGDDDIDYDALYGKRR